MKSPLLVLHDALLDRIGNETNWLIFDNVPENETFPYISMGAVNAREWSDKFVDGQEVIITLDFWSKYHGKAEALEMMNDVLQAITSSPLDLGSNFRAAYSNMDLNEIIIDIDGFARHGILKIRYLIEEI